MFFLTIHKYFTRACCTLSNNDEKFSATCLVAFKYYNFILYSPCLNSLIFIFQISSTASLAIILINFSFVL